MQTKFFSKKTPSTILIQGLFLLLVGVVILVPVLFSSSTDANDLTFQADSNLAESFGEDHAITFAQSQQIFNQLRGAWTSSAMRERGLYTRAEQNQFQEQLGFHLGFFPEYIGGLYFDDYGRLVILVVEQQVDDTVSLQSRSRALSNEEIVTTRTVRFSHNQLAQAKDTVTAAMRSNCDTSQFNTDLIFMHGVDVRDNRMAIYMVDNGEQANPENIALFRQYVLDCPSLIFIFGERPVFCWQERLLEDIS